MFVSQVGLGEVRCIDGGSVERWSMISMRSCDESFVDIENVIFVVGVKVLWDQEVVSIDLVR